MKRVLTLVLCTAIGSAAYAVEAYNQNITAIYGSGNTNAGWTTDTGNGITLGLRGKNRDNNATTNNGADTYFFATGVGANPLRAVWNYDFSINAGKDSAGANIPLTAFDFYFTIDMDSSAAILPITFNPLIGYNDNDYGDDTTANGAGATGTFLAVGLSASIAQNSQNITFQGHNPFADGTYSYELFAVTKGASSDSTRLASVDITVVVGAGGASVPDTGSSLMMLSTGLVALFAAARRKLGVR